MWLRLENATTIEEANILLPKLIEKYNTKFSLQEHNTKNAFEKQVSDDKINLTLAVITRRTIDSSHAIKFRNKYYRLVNSRNIPIYFSKGTKCMVIEAFDKKMFATIDESIFALQEIPQFQAVSKTFDVVEEPKLQYVYIPKMIHPWKAQSFTNFIEKQNKKMELENKLVLSEE